MYILNNELDEPCHDAFNLYLINIFLYIIIFVKLYTQKHIFFTSTFNACWLMKHKIHGSTKYLHAFYIGKQNYWMLYMEAKNYCMLYNWEHIIIYFIRSKKSFHTLHWSTKLLYALHRSIILLHALYWSTNYWMFYTEVKNCMIS